MNSRSFDLTVIPVAAHLNEWHARLSLSFAKQATGKTVLAESRHEGPLLVQKALYPEGPEICHVAILHPPSGIAGGDVLAINIHADAGTHALLTTPGATRWYKANGGHASQTIHIVLDANARLDWLPQENIVFEQAQATLSTHLHLQTGSRAIGWEITQLGSIALATHWSEGAIRLNTQLTLDEHPIWLEAGEIQADGLLRGTDNGLAGFLVMATLWAFGPRLSAEPIEKIAQSLPWSDSLRAGISCLPQENGQDLCLLRVLGRHTAEVKALLIDTWMWLRPLVLDVRGEYLRLWNT